MSLPRMKHRLAVTAAVLLLGSTAAIGHAQQDTAQDTAQPAGPPPLAFDSPRSTMFTFLRAVNDVAEGDQDQLRVAAATLDLSQVGVAPTSDAARRLVRDLWRALNHIREVEASELPGRGTVGPDQTTFLYFPRPFHPDDEALLERVDIGNGVVALARSADGRWLFSAQTAANIGALADALSDLPDQVDVDVGVLDEPLWVRQTIPSSLRRGGLLGLLYWQWLGLLVLIFIGVVADFLIRLLLTPIATRIVNRYVGEFEHRVLRDTTRAVALFGTALIWTSLVRLLALADPAGAIATAATGVFAVFAGTLAGWRLADLASDILMHYAARTESKFDDILVPLLRKTLKLFIVALGIVYGAQNLNINIVPLLTGLGIGGLAFAFAAKDTIENLFGSIAVILDRPFEVGDWVVVGEVEGTVEELGFRSTRIRTFYNSQVTVPNATLVRAQVDNYGRRRYRRWKTYVGVQYDTSPEKLLAFTEGIRELVRQHPYTRKDYYQVWLNEFADSSLNILLYIFHEVPDWSTELRERERMFIDIVRLADRLGVEFAFPTRTLHLYSEEHAAPSSKYEIPQGTNDLDAMERGLVAAREITRDRMWKRGRPGPVRYSVDGATQMDLDRGGDG